MLSEVRLESWVEITQTVKGGIDSRQEEELCVYNKSYFYFALFKAKSWLIREDPDARKDWGQEEKRATEDKMDGW